MAAMIIPPSEATCDKIPGNAHRPSRMPLNSGRRWGIVGTSVGRADFNFRTNKDQDGMEVTRLGILTTIPDVARKAKLKGGSRESD